MTYLITGLLFVSSLFANECKEFKDLSENDKLSKLKLVKEEVCINLHLSKDQKVNLTLLSDKMNNCIGKVMANSPIEIDIKLNCSKDGSLNNWEEATKFGLYDPLLNSSGNNVDYNELGYKTKSYSFFVSNKVKRSSAKSYWPNNIPIQEKLDAIKAGEIDRQCKEYYEKVLNPFQQQSYSDLGISSKEYKALQKKYSKEHQDICDPGYVLQDKYPNRKLPSGSCAHIRPEKDINNLSQTLVHELMHLYAGLADRYNASAEEREKWSSNLMGLNSTCSPLTNNQVNSLIDYRLNGTEEDY